LVWFHFAEFSDKDAHGNWVFLALLIACNIFTVGFCLACAWRSFVFLRRELQRFSVT
jgi:hypothetical protein